MLSDTPIISLRSRPIPLLHTPRHSSIVCWVIRPSQSRICSIIFESLKHMCQKASLRFSNRSGCQSTSLSLYCLLISQSSRFLLLKIFYFLAKSLLRWFRQRFSASDLRTVSYCTLTYQCLMYLKISQNFSSTEALASWLLAHSLLISLISLKYFSGKSILYSQNFLLKQPKFYQRSLNCLESDFIEAQAFLRSSPTCRMPRFTYIRRGQFLSDRFRKSVINSRSLLDRAITVQPYGNYTFSTFLVIFLDRRASLPCWNLDQSGYRNTLKAFELDSYGLLQNQKKNVFRMAFLFYFYFYYPLNLQLFSGGTSR